MHIIQCCSSVHERGAQLAQALADHGVPASNTDADDLTIDFAASAPDGVYCTLVNMSDPESMAA